MRSERTILHATLAGALGCAASALALVVRRDALNRRGAERLAESVRKHREAERGEALRVRIDRLEAKVERGRGSPQRELHLVDKGAAMLDAARARLMSAEAELKELEVAAARRTGASPGEAEPIEVAEVRIKVESGSGAVDLTFLASDDQSYRLVCPTAIARDVGAQLRGAAKAAEPEGR